MNSFKYTFKRTLLLITLAVFVLLSAIIFQFISKGPSQSIALLPIPTIATHKQSRLPLRLRIPIINVNAFIEYAGLDSQGSMVAPIGLANVSWFNLGPRPGDKGNAVIAGHYGWVDGVPAVFNDISKLKKGDKIYIEAEKGSVISFVVSDLQTYGKDENTSSVFLPKDKKAHLILITCDGVWNGSQKTYSNRLVVFSDRVM